MSITLILAIIVAITAIVLVTLLVGLKKIFDRLEYFDVELKQRDNALLEYQDLMKTLFENKNNELKAELSNKIRQILENSQIKFDELSTLFQKNSKLLENELQLNFKSIHNSSEKQSNNLIETITKYSENILTQNNELNKLSKEILTNSFESISNQIIESSNTTTKSINKYLEIQDKNTINIQTKLDNSFSSILQLVNNLRLDNLINVSNEIGKYKEGIFEDEHFLQEVGHCRVIRLTDKVSGNITNVHYNENGEKSYTETYSSDFLIYKMNYQSGKLISGVEFNNNGDILFEYFYDDAEEVKKKIEYIYDQNFNLKEQKKINY
ncbi:hypothetical protein LXN10_01050 [Arcobacter sp. KX21116]|uniref:hypothetical protein n=1 Tax=Arcobacter iocasae TaxID=2906515 RepID=UPI0035D3F168